MSEIVLRDMSEYPQVLRRLFQWGERRSPRGIATLDAGFVTIMLVNPAGGGMPLGIGRGLNPAIGAVEAAQLIAGLATPRLVLNIAPQFARYTEDDDGVEHRSFWGAYGERIKMQARAVVQKLVNDPDTRQAIITLWDPWLDNVPDKRDYPCTIALHFFIQGQALYMNTIMRSNDAWLGLPYDIFQFTQLQETVATALGIEPGVYRHTALSLHLYESNVADANALIANFDEAGTAEMRRRFAGVFQPSGIGDVGMSFVEIMRRADKLLMNIPLEHETESERWYRDQLHPTTKLG